MDACPLANKMFQFWLRWHWRAALRPAWRCAAPEHPGPDGYLDCKRRRFLTSWRAAAGGGCVCVSEGVVLSVSCLPSLFCGKSFEVWLGLSHRACCLALPQVFLPRLTQAPRKDGVRLVHAASLKLRSLSPQRTGIPRHELVCNFKAEKLKALVP